MALDNAKWFDDNTYLNNKLAQLKALDADTYGSWKVADVEQAFVDAGFAKGAEGVFAHFNQYGNTADENLSPNSHFNANQYYIFKAANLYHDDDVSAVTDAEAAYVKTAIKEAGMSAWQHYVDYGTEEGVNPSNDFDTNKYLDAKAAALNAAKVDGKTTWTADEVAKAISDAGMNALSHAMQYADGTSAGEAAAPFDANGKVIDAYKVDNPVDTGDGETYTLTTSPDNIPGTAADDTINGYVSVNNAGTSTFTAADVINGAGGTDTFNIVLDGDDNNAAVNMPAAQITNVEKFMVRDTTTGGGVHTYAFAGIDGETEVWADRATHNVVFTGLGTGTKVGVQGANGVDSGNVNFSMATAADAVNLVFDSVKDTNGAAAAITNDGGSATEATITATGTKSTLGAINLAAGTAAVKTLTITADADLATDGITGFGTDAAISVGGGAENVALGDLAVNVKSVDASGLTAGGVTAATSAAAPKLVTFKGGAGKDSLTMNDNVGATAQVNLGAGDDSFTVANTKTVAAGAKIDGGAGKDSLSLHAVTLGNGSAFTNFEYFDLAHTQGDYELNLLGLTGAEKFILSGALGADTNIKQIAATGTTLDITGEGDNALLNMVVSGATTGTSDTFTVNFAHTSDAAGATEASAKLQLGDIETVNIVSEAGKNVSNELNYMLITNARATAENPVSQTVNISGSADLALTLTEGGAHQHDLVAERGEHERRADDDQW